LADGLVVINLERLGKSFFLFIKAGAGIRTQVLGSTVPRDSLYHTPAISQPDYRLLPTIKTLDYLFLFYRFGMRRVSFWMKRLPFFFTSQRNTFPKNV
jgi:hypothetical protein